MPRCVICATGMLFVPAPQRAMARTELGTSSFLSLYERKRMACDSTPVVFSSLTMLNFFLGKMARPSGEMALYVLSGVNPTRRKAPPPPTQ